MALRVLSFDVGTKNLAACDLTVEANGSFTVTAWTVESCVARGVNVNKTPVHELAPTFYNFIKKRINNWFYNDDKTSKNIGRVFIENQPLGGRGAARNLKTKILSHILQCVIAEAVPEVPISFVHPGLKLKDMPRVDGARPTYRQNKLYAIAKTTEIVESDLCLNKHECAALYIVKKMKKDDLADAFLQGLLAGSMYVRGDVIEPPSEDRPKKRKAKAEIKEASPAEPAAAGAPVADPATETDEKPAKAPKAPKAPKEPKKPAKRAARAVVADEAEAVPEEAPVEDASPKKKARKAAAVA